MSKPKILVQLDTDSHASVFDAVVAVDAGVQHLLQYAKVQPGDVRGLVHGAIFTRGPQDLKNTAIFIGGSNVAAGEALLAQVQASFFGPLRVSVLLDANGANTTAAAAVVALARHLPLKGLVVVVLAATGPVGQRVVRLLTLAGAEVRAVSRDESRASSVCQAIQKIMPDARLSPHAVNNDQDLQEVLRGARAVVAAGAAGVRLLPLAVREAASSVQLAIDLNAVPPVGIEGVDPMDKAKDRGGRTCYGAIGIGGTKMKIHKAALQRLFESNDQILDADQTFALARALEGLDASP